MLRRNFIETVRILAEQRDNLTGLALSGYHQVAELDCIELRRMQGKILIDSGITADIFAHFLRQQGVLQKGLILLK